MMALVVVAVVQPARLFLKSGIATIVAACFSVLSCLTFFASPSGLSRNAPLCFGGLAVALVQVAANVML